MARAAGARLVMGIGNHTHPASRHSVGLMVLDRLAARFQAPWEHRRDCKGHVATIRKPGLRLVLLRSKVLTNESGKCASAALRALRAKPHDLCVVHDDLQRNLGKLSWKAGGSANGHNGIKSVTRHAGTDVYERLRVGIGPRPHSRSHDAVSRFVLGDFDNDELGPLEVVLERSCDMLVDAFKEKSGSD